MFHNVAFLVKRFLFCGTPFLPKGPRKEQGWFKLADVANWLMAVKNTEMVTQENVSRLNICLGNSDRIAIDLRRCACGNDAVASSSKSDFVKAGKWVLSNSSPYMAAILFLI